ncbi:MAG TPA: hypothetical protein VEJ47_07370 [Candidatus Eremiobacteraceae bacterium]|nr:hypothetical protein [Candidatus Eremiobacteraceae bacterium]
MRRCLPVVLLLLASAQLAEAQSFTHIQGQSNNGASPTGITEVLPQSPGKGHLLVFWLFLYGNTTFSNLVVKDAKNNAFTLTPQSVANSMGTAQDGFVYAGYILSTPARMSATISATWTGNGRAYLMNLSIDEFSYTGGTPAFDREIYYDSIANSVTGTTMNLPAIVPSQSGELLYAGGQGTSHITAPYTGGTLGLWSGSGGGYSTYDSDATAEYILSSPSTSTAINITMANSGSGWLGYIMAIKLVGGGTPHTTGMTETLTTVTASVEAVAGRAYFSFR